MSTVNGAKRKRRHIGFMTNLAADRHKARRREQFKEALESGSVKIYNVHDMSPRARRAAERRLRMR